MGLIVQFSQILDKFNIHKGKLLILSSLTQSSFMQLVHYKTSLLPQLKTTSFNISIHIHFKFNLT